MDSKTIAARFARHVLSNVPVSCSKIALLLAKAGLSPNLLDVDNNPVDATKFCRLLRLLIDSMQDESIGLMERSCPPGTFAMGVKAVINLPQLDVLNKRWVDYFNLFNTGFIYQICSDNTRVRYCLYKRHSQSISNNFMVEACLLLWYRFMCWLLQEHVVIQQLGFAFSKPLYADTYATLYPNVNASFSQQCNFIEIDAGYLARRHHRSEDNLFQFLDQAPENLLMPPPLDGDLVSRLRDLVTIQLRKQKQVPSVEWLARRQNVSVQVLRRQLKKQHTSYHELKAQVLSNAARNMLSQRLMSVEGISGQLGFSEPSSFIRAFKSWAGETPLSYRKRC